MNKSKREEIIKEAFWRGWKAGVKTMYRNLPSSFMTEFERIEPDLTNLSKEIAEKEASQELLKALEEIK